MIYMLTYVLTHLLCLNTYFPLTGLICISTYWYIIFIYLPTSFYGYVYVYVFIYISKSLCACFIHYLRSYGLICTPILHWLIFLLRWLIYGLYLVCADRFIYLSIMYQVTDLVLMFHIIASTNKSTYLATAFTWSCHIP